MIRKGKLIVFIGVDGSGKTTQTEKLLKELSSRGKTAVQLKIFSFFFLSIPLRMIKLLFRRRTNQGKTATTNTIDSVGKILAKRGFIFMAAIDLWFNYLIKVLPFLYRHEYVVSDRYYYDYGPNLLRVGCGSEKSVRLFLRLLPKPDHCFYLRISAARVRKRKKEFSLQYMEQLVKYYRVLFHNFRGAIEMEADLQINVLNEQVLKRLTV